MPRNITLEWREILLATTVGSLRNVFAMKHNGKHRYGADAFLQWDTAITGALGELAVAKHLEVYWDGTIGNVGPGDVDTIEVRTTPYASGHLIVHPEDPEAAPFVLVTGVPPTFRIVGWILGGDAKQSQWWRETDRSAYFVPQDDLYSIESLERPKVSARYEYKLTLRDVREAARRLMA